MANFRICLLWYLIIILDMLTLKLLYCWIIIIYFSRMSSDSNLSSNQPETWNTSASRLGRCWCLHHWDWRWRFLQAGPEQEPDKWAGEPGPAESTDTMTEEWSDWRGCWRRKRRREEEKRRLAEGHETKLSDARLVDDEQSGILTGRLMFSWFTLR